MKTKNTSISAKRSRTQLKLKNSSDSVRKFRPLTASKKTTRKVSKVSTSNAQKSAAKYWARIRRIMRTNKIDVQSARNLYNTIDRTDARRFERITAKSLSRLPKRVKNSKDFERYTKASTRKSEKGLVIVYYDTLLGRVVDGKSALHARRELQVERVALSLQERLKSEQRSFVKFWPERAKKRGNLTAYEAKNVAKKILKQRWGNNRLFNGIRRILGES